MIRLEDIRVMVGGLSFQQFSTYEIRKGSSQLSLGVKLWTLDHHRWVLVQPTITLISRPISDANGWQASAKAPER